MKKKIVLCMMAAMVLFGGCSRENEEIYSTELPSVETEHTEAADDDEAAETTETTAGNGAAETTETGTGNGAAGTTEAAENDSGYEVEMTQFRKDELCDISYPQISGWSNAEKQQEWNEIFEKCAEEAVQDVGENDSVNMSFTVEEQTEDFLSMTVSYYYDFEEAPHPSMAMKSFNINMKTGEQVTFADMADPKETAELLFNGTEGYTLVEGVEMTMKEILEDNFIWMEPTVEALEASLSHFDGEVEDYGENETMGYSFRRNGKVCLIFYVSHAMGDYAVVQLEN